MGPGRGLEVTSIGIFGYNKPGSAHGHRGSVFLEVVELAHTTGPMSCLSVAGTRLKRGSIERLGRGEYAPAQRSVPPLRVALAEAASCQ